MNRPRKIELLVALALPLLIASSVAMGVGSAQMTGGTPPPGHPKGQMDHGHMGHGMAHSAQATLEAAPGAKAAGTVTFTQDGDQVRIVAEVSGVEPGKHGLHVHENGSCTHDPAGKHFSSAGGHFNPTGAAHACPDAAAHHAGDFGNIVVGPDGTGKLEITTSMLSLSGPNSVVGKGIILHAGEDDCTSQPAGNAGARLGCGVVKAPMAHMTH